MKSPIERTSLLRPSVLSLIVPMFVVFFVPNSCMGQLFYSYANGKQFKVEVSRAAIAKAPQWKPDSDHPPLTARKALDLAKVVRERLVKDGTDFKWRLLSIQLTPYDERQDGWYWVVSYGGNSGRKLPFRLAVLMDGSVPEPTVKEYPLRVPLAVPSRAPASGSAESFSSPVDGKHFRVDVGSAQIGKAPQWKTDAVNPPLSARKALTLASAVKERLVKDDTDGKWRLDSIRLTSTEGEDGWIWLVVYEKVLQEGFHSGPAITLSLAVLMDGTVPEPTVTKQ